MSQEKLKFKKRFANIKPSFLVPQDLLDHAYEGNGKALFRIGLQALAEKRFGFAMAFFNLAARHGCHRARGYSAIALRQLMESANQDNFIVESFEESNHVECIQ